jgi:hypothetical protein
MELVTNFELGNVGVAVEERGRLNELVKALEMSYIQSTLANDPHPACTVLFSWSREMMGKYSNIRLRLVHCLSTIGMHDIACRYVLLYSYVCYPALTTCINLETDSKCL